MRTSPICTGMFSTAAEPPFVETFAHWEFATGTGDQVKDVAQFFGLTYFTEKDEIVHALRTAIVSPDGKVARIYQGNEWKTDEVIEEIKKAASTPTP